MRSKDEGFSCVFGVGADYPPNPKFETIPVKYFRSYLLRDVDE
jgi:hypothetical protein